MANGFTVKSAAAKAKKEEREYAKDRMEYLREFHRVIAPVVVLKKDK